MGWGHLRLGTRSNRGERMTAPRSSTTYLADADRLLEIATNYINDETLRHQSATAIQRYELTVQLAIAHILMAREVRQSA